MNLQQTIRRLDWRVVFTGLLVAWLCANFWLGSRYPSLQGKASADPNEALSTPLGFEAHFPEPPPSEFMAHWLWTALEWAVTNKQGMTFGLLLAAGILTLLPLLPRPGGGRFAGTLHGAMVGLPLGVCVNCAAPIAQGMLKSGSRVETALATLFTSPSFNVIVVSMLFTLFPWHLVALKLAASAAMVLLIVPWLARLAERPGWQKPPAAPMHLPGLGLFQRFDGWFSRASQGLSQPPGGQQPGVFRALVWVGLNYPKNLVRVVIMALPLMLLAGLIGAVLVEVLPWDDIAALTHLDGWWKVMAVVVVVTAFSVLLPVPIAFDVVICSVMWNAGVPAYVLVPMLVTLGIYSVYPWSLLGTTLSWRIASLAGAAVFALGLVSGAGAAVLQRWHEIDQAQRTAAILRAIPAPATTAPHLPKGRPAMQLDGLAPALPDPQAVARGDGWELLRQDFRDAAAPDGELAFRRIDGPDIGLERLPLPRPYQGMEPTVMHLGALASGDINADGWPDLAIGSYFGVWLYRNLGGHFTLQQVDFPAMRDWIIGDVALIDLDGDGAEDLFFGTWMHGSHILFNRNGQFSATDHLELPRHTETVITAAAFGDLDKDGDIDIVTGGASAAAWFFYPEVAVNTLWRNQGGRQFGREELPGPQGDTLSLLLQDLNDDGWDDLLVGNDFDEPDRVYLNRRGQLEAVSARHSPIPYSTTTTMSFDSGDINNDGKDELYVSQIAMGKMNELPKKLADPYRSCGIYDDVADRARCDAIVSFQVAVVRARNIERVQLCEGLADPAHIRDCVVTAYHWNRIIVRQPSLGAGKAEILAECEKIPADYTTMHDLCAALADSPMDYNQSARRFSEELHQVAHTNLLFSPAESGYADITAQWKSGFGGWSWNAKFADLDNDGWQDLYVAQGSRLRASSPYSPLYRNRNGRGFDDVTRDWGLQDHRPTGAYLYLDYDRDGDLDVLTYPFLLSPVMWRNNLGGQSVEWKLSQPDHANNAAIGADIRLVGEGQQQLRRIKASGGYMSHDWPVAHFGLGQLTQAKYIEVRWPDGATTRIQPPILEPGTYTLRRH